MSVTSRLRRQAVLFGPAFVAATAYVDPGNVATNTVAGARYRYLLVWVLLPALAELAVGANPTRALVLSQVVLSFGIPFALVPLVLLTSRRGVMGADVNGRATAATAWAITAVVVALNVALIVV